MKKTLLSWSSGKDSAWALQVLRQDPGIELLGLVTVINQRHERVSMHGTRMEMLHRQAEAVGLPLETISLPDPSTPEECDEIMGKFVTAAVAKGVECMAFGDLFLEDIRQYRESRLKGSGLEPLFPLWSIPTAGLAEQMLAGGLEAYVSSVDLRKLPSRFAGRKWSMEMIREFPTSCDPCGEHGEIHTIVVGGPMFEKSIPITVGDISDRQGFAYADIAPATTRGQDRPSIPIVRAPSVV